MSELITGMESSLTQNYQLINSDGTNYGDALNVSNFINATPVQNVKFQPTFLQDYGSMQYDMSYQYPNSSPENTAENTYNNMHNNTATVLEPYQEPEITVSQESGPKYTKITKCRARNTFKQLLNIFIVLLIVALIGVLVYLTCKRYNLVGDAIDAGNSELAALLLTPELSAGLTTLAAIL